jgi:chain length determinant protein tyrosine kinase EpsG
MYTFDRVSPLKPKGIEPSLESTTQNAKTAPPASEAARERSIGDIIREANNLSADQVEQVLAHQRQHGMRFGEAAVALGLIETSDVLWALSQQFHYPYTPEARAKLHAELVVANRPFSEQAEAFRSIRSQLTMRLHSGQNPRRAIAVVSPDSGDGKTFFAANLAIAYSQLGGRTLLIDADLRSPRQHELFGIDNAVGLSGVLSGRSLKRVVHPVIDLPSLFVLPVGTPPPNPLELLERPAFNLLMNDLLNQFDHVVVDTPAAAAGADASVIAARCGAALAIARRGRSRLTALQDLVALLKETPVHVVGALLNEF